MQFSGYQSTASGVTSHLPQIIIHTGSKEVHVWHNGEDCVTSWLAGHCWPHTSDITAKV